MKYKSLIIFGVGVAVGALGTWKFFERKSEEQIKAMENVLKNKAREEETAEDSTNTDSIFSKSPKVEMEKVTTSIDVDRIKEFKDSVNHISYNQYDSSMPDEITVNEEKEYEKQMSENEHPTDDYGCVLPYRITREEFEDNVSETRHYEKVCAYIYDDGALVNALTEEIMDTGSIGFDNYDWFRNHPDKREITMYVRNESDREDYEVDAAEGNWYEMDEATRAMSGGFEYSHPEVERGEDMDEFELGLAPEFDEDRVDWGEEYEEANKHITMISLEDYENADADYEKLECHIYRNQVIAEARNRYETVSVLEISSRYFDWFFNHPERDEMVMCIQNERSETVYKITYMDRDWNTDEFYYEDLAKEEAQAGGE